MHKLGCQYGASANWPLLSGLGSCSKKKEQAATGGLGQSELRVPVKEQVVTGSLGQSGLKVPLAASRSSHKRRVALVEVFICMDTLSEGFQRKWSDE